MADVGDITMISSVVNEQADVVVACLVGIVVVELIYVSISSIIAVYMSHSPHPKDESDRRGVQ